jgi:uncharacterized membrane protein
MNYKGIVVGGIIGAVFFIIAANMFPGYINNGNAPGTPYASQTPMNFYSAPIIGFIVGALAVLGSQLIAK